MKRRLGLLSVVMMLAAGCGASTERTQPATIASATTTTIGPATTIAAITTAATTTATATASTSSTLPASTTTIVTTASTIAPTTTTTSPATTAPPASVACGQVGTPNASTTGTYSEAAFDSFGPLEQAPSLTINVNPSTPAGGPLAPHATRIEGGLLLTAGRSPEAPFVPGAPVGHLLVAAINHDGTVRWSRCIPGVTSGRAIVAAPEQRPANALVAVDIQIGVQPGYRWVQFSLATGAEQPTFAATTSSAGVNSDTLARLIDVAGTDRYVLLVAPTLAGPMGAADRILRYDLVTDSVVDIAVPAELASGNTGPCGMTPQLSLADSGDIVVTNGSTDSGGAVVARWHDGTWSRDPASLATAMGVHVTYACGDGSAGPADSLRGVDALGTVLWTKPALTRPGYEGLGVYVDGAVTVTQVCTRKNAGGGCDANQLVGIDQATGKVLWSQAGLRLLAGDPANGYLLVQSGDTLGRTSPGWVMLDDRSGRAVPGQSWTRPSSFNHPCCADPNSTVRSGGIVLVVDGQQLRVWYPKGTGGTPRTIVLNALPPSQ
jgi:PQQ-like domain